MRMMKMLLAGIAVLVATAAASQAAPMPTHLAAIRAAAGGSIVQVRWGGGRGGWHGGYHGGWGQAGWVHGGWGHRGVGYRPWGWGAVAAGAAIGGAIVNSGYDESYPAYGDDYADDEHYAYQGGYAHEGCYPYHPGHEYGGYSRVYYGW
jgi:hypothetical protein